MTHLLEAWEVLQEKDPVPLGSETSVITQNRPYIIT